MQPVAYELRRGGAVWNKVMLKNAVGIVVRAQAIASTAVADRLAVLAGD